MSCRLELSRAQFMAGCRRPNHACNDVLIEFSEKVLEISGLGDRTFVPDSKFPLDYLSSVSLHL